jgi:hypothetical protein
MGYRPGYRECDGRVLAPNALPLDYMLAVMRDAKVSDARRERMATLAAPYCHEKVAYRPLGKRDQKAKAARQAGKDTAWSSLIGRTAARHNGD